MYFIYTCLTTSPAKSISFLTVLSSVVVTEPAILYISPLVSIIYHFNLFFLTSSLASMTLIFWTFLSFFSANHLIFLNNHLTCLLYFWNGSNCSVLLLIYWYLIYQLLILIYLNQHFLANCGVAFLNVCCYF